jgi:YD repeat-containing protein
VIESVTIYGYQPFAAAGIDTELPTESYDPNGAVTRYCYELGANPCHDATLIDDPTPPDGLLRAVFGPEGEASYTKYDEHGRVTEQRTLIEAGGQ